MRSPLNPDVLRYVTEVAEVGSIRRAAERMHISASALNRQLLILEERLGTRLFEREARGMRPTQSGEIILNVARELERGFRDALEQVGTLTGLGSGKISFGTLTSIAETLVAPLVAELRARHPTTRTVCFAGNSSEVVRKVLEGDLDFGLCWDPPASTPVHRLASLAIPIGLAVRPTHPLASRNSIRLTECLDSPLVFPSRGMEFRAVIDRIKLGISHHVAPILEANSIQLLRQLCLCGPDPVMMTANSILDEIEDGSLAFVPLRDPGCGHLDLALFERSGITPTAVSGFVRDGLLRQLEELRGRVSALDRAGER